MFFYLKINVFNIYGWKQLVETATLQSGARSACDDDDDDTHSEKKQLQTYSTTTLPKTKYK